MQMKKIAQWALLIASGAGLFYTAVSCVKTLVRGITQPYLLAAGERVLFWGYFILSAVLGAACILCALVLFFTIRSMRKGRDNK